MALMDRWKFVLTKLDHTPIREVHQAFERKINIAMSKPSTASFTIRQDDPVLASLYGEDTLLQVWQGSNLRLWGPVISAQFNQEDSGAPTIAVSAADPSWRLIKRLSGKSKTGVKYESFEDKAAIASKIIADKNAEDDTEIEPGETKSGSTGAYTAGPYKPSLSCINELAHGLDGFDWVIEPLTGSATKIGTFVAAAVMGEEKPNAIFEYGTGKKNMRSMSYLRDLGGILNQAYHIPDEGLEGVEGVVSSKDNASIEMRGLYEETVDLNGVTNTTYRQQWVENQVAVRKDPRRVVALTSDTISAENPKHVPIPGEDYWLGDLVPARALVEGNVLFNGQVRVYAINVEVDNNGAAKVTPILVEEE